MTDGISRIAGVPLDADRRGRIAGCFRGLSPLAAPFLILLCAPRWELAAAAACWSVLILPGALAANLLLPVDHPLGRCVCRFAIASVGGLLLFGLVAWTGCMLHWTLTGTLILYGIGYAVCLSALLWSLIRRGSARTGTEEPWPKMKMGLGSPRWIAALVVLGILLFLTGVALATVQTRNPFTTPDLYGAREYWWQGTLLGAAAALLVAPLVLLGTRRPRSPTANPKPQPTGRSSKKSSRRRTTEPAGSAAPSGSWLVVFLWLAVAGLAWHTMNVAYALPTSDFPSSHRPPWNSDDVTYVAQAVDYRYDLPMGKHEPSIGSDRGMGRSNLAPLVAPLVGTIARVTGVGCAALHHSVLRPLVVLLGASALAGLLMVVFRTHRWAVPLGLLVVFMVIGKSWEYERSMAEFTVWRAMQSKSVHLWLIHPLQMASLLLLLFRPNKQHLLLGVTVAVVGHLVHPFSTILGVIWVTVLCAAAAVGRRNALLKSLILLACYGALGAEFRVVSRVCRVENPLSHGRTAGESEQSRDLVRVDDQPVLRQEPRILFGWNMMFNLGALAIPIVLAFGWRHREFLLLGLIGGVTVACCNSVLLGGLISKALPTSIFWRLRWVLPSLLHAAVVSFALYWALSILLRRRDLTMTPTRSFVASLAVAGVFAVMFANTSGYGMKAGPPPEQLSKFSDDLHGLVDLLGGTEASPFVWGPRTVGRELPQLMPNIRLALSRRRIMLPADHPQFRQLVFWTRNLFYMPTRGFKSGKAPQDATLRNALRQLTDLYPIDHVVLDCSADRGAQGARVLQTAGWQRIGRSGIYEVWRITPELKSATIR